MYEGAFSDGKTAVLREVRVEVTRSRLIIIGEEEAALDEWSIEGLRVANAIHGAGQPIRLVLKGADAVVDTTRFGSRTATVSRPAS